MAAPVQVSPFEAVRTYDAPGLIISNAIEGELTARGTFSTLFNSKGLSPSERTGFNQRIKEEYGGNPLADAAIDIATNPWVWLVFLTSIPGEAALVRGAGAITDVAKDYSAFFKKNAGFLQQLGLATSETSLRGTAVAPMIRQVETGLEELGREAGVTFVKQYNEYLRARGLPTLDYTAKGLSPAQAAEARETAFLLQARLEGWDQEVSRKVLKRLERGEDGRLTTVFEDEVSLPVVSFDVEKRMMEVGGTELLALADSMRKGFNQRAVRLFGKEGLAEGVFEADPKKISRLYAGLNNRLFGKAGHDGAAAIGRVEDGIDAIRAMLGDEVAEGLKAGSIKEAEFIDLVRHTAQEQYQANYFPRNLGERIRDLGPEAVIGLPGPEARAGARTLDVSKSVVARTRRTALYHPDDLDQVREAFGGRVTEEFERQYELADAIGRGDLADIAGRVADNKGRAKDLAQQAAAAKKRGDVALAEELKEEARGFAADARKWRGVANRMEGIPLFQRLNPQKAVTLHFADTGRTWAWHIQAPNKEVLDAQRRVFASNPEVLAGFDDTFPVLGKEKGKGPSISKAFDEIPEAEQPLGGFSLADGLWGQYAHIKDPYTQHLIPHFLIPASSGQYSVQQLATERGLLNMKAMVNRIAAGPFGKVLDEAGGKKMREGLLAWSDPEVGLGGAKSSTRWLANYLYVSHLGFNMASISLNAMQPLLLASTQLGARNVLKGYKNAVGELFGYLKERAGQGFRVLEEEEKRGLIAKHFRFANHNGDDLLGISPDFFETIDVVGRRAGLQPKGPASLMDRFFQASLAGFEKTEWLNRSVTAHAVENAYVKAGRSTLDGSFITDVRGMVGRTQFSGTLLNTPVAFLTQDRKLSSFGAFATNPLVRMFLNFPLRSVTEAVVYGPQLGGRVGLKPVVNDILRGMGVSAIAYEAGKNLLGADLSRGLYASSLGDALGGQRFFEGDSIVPVPPVVDIPVSIVQGLATGDVELLKYSLPRLVPGGVALSRMFGIAPDLPLIEGINPQRTYIDWNAKQPDGTVPLFKWDGTLIEFQKPSELVLKALGADLGTSALRGEVDGFLLKNQEEMRAVRRSATFALLNGDMRKFQAKKEEYQKRFGLPLTISETRVKTAQELMTKPRTQRILDKLPPEIREQYQAIVGEPQQQLQPAHLTEEMKRALAQQADKPKIQQPVLPGQNPVFSKFGAFGG